MKKLPTRRWMSLWRHFLNREKTQEQLTASMIDWQEKWQWDLLKINPPACYHVMDWGAAYEFFEDPYREPRLISPVVQDPTDIDRIGLLDTTRGVLGQQLQVIRNLRSHFGPDLPIVETVFSPIEIAHRLMPGRETLLRIRIAAPDALHRLLQTIQRVFQEFCVECLKAGADGIFFATKWANSDLLTWQEYEEFGKRYEQPILQALRESDALVILHVCGAKTYLEQMLDYPVDMFSYDFFAEGVPAPQDVIARSGRFVLGGIDPDRLNRNVRSVVHDCYPFSGLPKWLIGPSCVLTPNVSDDALRTLKKELCSTS